MMRDSTATGFGDRHAVLARLAATACAECAWVLWWQEMSGSSDTAGHFTEYGISLASSSEQECRVPQSGSAEPGQVPSPLDNRDGDALEVEPSVELRGRR
jgi:hypothetical protein